MFQGVFCNVENEFLQEEYIAYTPELVPIHVTGPEAVRGHDLEGLDAKKVDKVWVILSPSIQNPDYRSTQ